MNYIFGAAALSFVTLIVAPNFWFLFTHSKFHANVKTHNKQIQNTLCRLKIRTYHNFSLALSLSLSLRFTSSFFKRFVGQSTSSSSLFVVVVVVAAVFVVVSVIEVMTLDSSDSFRRFLIEFLAIAMNFPFFHSLFFSSLSVCNFHYLALTP